MTPSREERVEQVMPVRDSLLEAVPITTLVPASRDLRYTDACMVSTLHIASAILPTISPCTLVGKAIVRSTVKDRPPYMRKLISL